MNALRQIVSPFNGQILIDIPQEYKQKRFEVIVFPLDDLTEKEALQAKMNLFLETLPNTEPIISDKEIMAEIKAVRKQRYEK